MTATLLYRQRNANILDTHFEIAVFQLSAVQSVVNIRASRRVDRADVELTKVNAAFDILKK